MRAHLQSGEVEKTVSYAAQPLCFNYLITSVHVRFVGLGNEVRGICWYLFRERGDGMCSLSLQCLCWSYVTLLWWLDIWAISDRCSLVEKLLFAAATMASNILNLYVPYEIHHDLLFCISHVYHV